EDEARARALVGPPLALLQVLIGATTPSRPPFRDRVSEANVPLEEPPRDQADRPARPRPARGVLLLRADQAARAAPRRPARRGAAGGRGHGPARARRAGGGRGRAQG